MENKKSHEFSLKIVSIIITLMIIAIIGMSIYQNFIVWQRKHNISNGASENINDKCAH